MTRNKPIVLVLAAGTSDRMGRLKAFLPFDEHRTFLQKILDDSFAFGCPDVWVVLNTEGMEQVRKRRFSRKVHFVLNEHPEKERFYSLQTGLKAVPRNTPVFLHNGDNPLIDAAVLNTVWRNYGKNTVTIPEFQNKGGHPILLAPEIIRDIVEEKNAAQHLNDFLKKYDQKRVPVDNPGILVNINTAEDYEKYLGKVLK